LNSREEDGYDATEYVYDRKGLTEVKYRTLIDLLGVEAAEALQNHPKKR
jgi:hypothetical protein